MMELDSVQNELPFEIVVNQFGGVINWKDSKGFFIKRNDNRPNHRVFDKKGNMKIDGWLVTKKSEDKNKPVKNHFFHNEKGPSFISYSKGCLRYFYYINGVDVSANMKNFFDENNIEYKVGDCISMATFSLFLMNKIGSEF